MIFETKGDYSTEYSSNVNNHSLKKLELKYFMNLLHGIEICLQTDGFAPPWGCCATDDDDDDDDDSSPESAEVRRGDERTSSVAKAC
ncbi:hypothetical protein CEXT_317401 [Caerostris extrusa]|uniref:Uncharacterized protein n=1 Tax=Caerostris extrusa TaxID=172846 RepID=A0AAV4PJB5_CAEEX|nr:hypothetical protein CEXT_317401 [Caerostris extrusa]